MGRVIVNGGSHHLTSWETLLLENLFFFWEPRQRPRTDAIRGDLRLRSPGMR